MGCCAHSGPFVSKPLMESIGLGPLGLKNKWKVRDSAFRILEGRVAASECSSEEFHLFDTSDSPCSGGSGRFFGVVYRTDLLSTRQGHLPKPASFYFLQCRARGANLSPLFPPYPLLNTPDSKRLPGAISRRPGGSRAETRSLA